ncbi:hypothetical protein D3C84_1199080 [compost metagenome]
MQLPDASTQTLSDGQGLLLEDEPCTLQLSSAAAACLYIARLYRQPEKLCTLFSSLRKRRIGTSALA